jgi:hypothetical protein
MAIGDGYGELSASDSALRTIDAVWRAIHALDDLHIKQRYQIEVIKAGLAELRAYIKEGMVQLELPFASDN